MRKIFFIGLLLCSVAVFGQEQIDITDQTFKLGRNEEKILYFGFAEGDKIVFNFMEINNKTLKEVEILEYPNNPKFSDFKTMYVGNKTINVTKTGIYVFRFKASAGRICKIKIQRISANEETKNFNTSVTWETKQETTYNTYTKDVIVGYDTTYVQKTKKELIKTEYKEDVIKEIPVHITPKINLFNDNYTTVKIDLPQNEFTSYKTRKIVTWACWIGVGQEAAEAWKKNLNTIKNLVVGLGGAYISGGTLAKPSFDIASKVEIPTRGDQVSFWFIPDYNNAQLFMVDQPFSTFDKGRGVAGYIMNYDRLQGTFYIGLLNNNKIRPIDVKINVLVMWETNYYEDKQYTEMNVTPRYEKKIFSDPVVKTSKVPVIEK